MIGHEDESMHTILSLIPVRQDTLDDYLGHFVHLEYLPPLPGIGRDKVSATRSRSVT